jgi:amino acid transporter
MQSLDKGVAPTWLKVFGAPVIIGLISLAGLLAALLLGEIGRYFSWIAVGSPVILVVWRFKRQRSSNAVIARKAFKPDAAPRRSD